MAGAAPVPAPSEQELIARHWGKAEGDGGFELKGGRLTLRLAGEGGSAELRVVRTVRGDFTAEVWVEAECPDPARDDAQHPGTRAGLTARGGESTVSLHLLQGYTRGPDGNFQPDAQRQVAADSSGPNFSSSALWGDSGAGRAAHLRLARTGKAVDVSYSRDGKEWASVTVPGDLAFPDEVTVGVFLSQTTRQKLSASFEKFAIEKPKK